MWSVGYCARVRVLCIFIIWSLVKNKLLMNLVPMHQPWDPAHLCPELESSPRIESDPSVWGQPAAPSLYPGNHCPSLAYQLFKHNIVKTVSKEGQCSQNCRALLAYQALGMLNVWLALSLNHSAVSLPLPGSLLSFSWVNWLTLPDSSRFPLTYFPSPTGSWVKNFHPVLLRNIPATESAHCCKMIHVLVS